MRQKLEHTLALLGCLFWGLQPTCSFHSTSSSSRRRTLSHGSSSQRYVSATAASSFSSDFASPSSSNSHNSSTTTSASGTTAAASDFFADLLFQDNDDDVDQARLERRMQLRQQNAVAASKTTPNTQTYRVTLPLASSSSAHVSAARALGLHICEVRPGKRVSEVHMDLDSLETTRLPDCQASESASKMGSTVAASLSRGEIVRLVTDPSFSGLIVSFVDPASVAWEKGIRPGDVVHAMSATIGDAVWPKSTLDGVRSALASRRLTSSTIVLDLERVVEKATDNQYELTLTRPIGLILSEPSDGYGVEVTGLSEIAPTLVRYAVKVGDRVIAVDSSVGDRMWPASSVEGVISACTSRLPGQSVTLRFERPSSVVVAASTTTAAAPFAAAGSNGGEGAVTLEKAQNSDLAGVASSDSATSLSAKNTQLLKRCRDVLRRYVKEEDMLYVQSKFRGKYALPAIVADKVVDALASSSASVDCITLSMIMDAYLSCRQPDRALRIFEASTGFSADASLRPPSGSSTATTGRPKTAIVPNEAALNLFTGTSLMKAHAMNGDLASVSRVLAALEGRSGAFFGGLETAPWPWTGTYGSIQLDTQACNVAMAAAEMVGGSEALQFALGVFHRMAEPTSVNDRSTSSKPRKDAVSYNTLISLLGNEGRSEDAFRLFDDMKRSGLRPDKYTYTSLIKACDNQDDVQELLYDMRELGVEPDCVTYNTMIKSLGEARRWTLATKLITEMESRGVVPDSMTYGYLMNAMLKTDKPSACLALFESACASPKTSALTENIYLYTTAITAAAMLGDHERALELVSRMNALGIKPNLITLTAVMGACLSSGRPDLASQLFQRMEHFDGYAMAQGIQALCADGQLGTALELLQQQQRGKQAKMKGKELMRSYHAVIQESLQRGDYGTARAAVSDLFRKGYIPSKPIVHTVLETIKLPSSRSLLLDPVEDAESSRQRISFILFLMDKTIERKLPVEARLYASTIAYANRLGGLYRKLATLMMEAKTSVSGTAVQQLLSSGGGSDGVDAPETPDDRTPVGSTTPRTWEEVIKNYDTYKEALSASSKAGSVGSGTAAVLPPLPVRLAARDAPRVMRAEQAVTFGRRRKPLPLPSSLAQRL